MGAEDRKSSMPAPGGGSVARGRPVPRPGASRAGGGARCRIDGARSAVLHGCHRQSRADLGPGDPHPGRHVHRRREARWSGRATGVLSRLRRVQGVEMGEERRRAGAPDVARRLLAGHTQIARSLAFAVDERRPAACMPWCWSATPSRKRSASIGPGAGRSVCWVCRFSRSRRAGTLPRAGLPPDRQAQRWPALRLRLGQSRRAAPTAGAVAAYASGGAAAMDEYARLHGGAARRLLDQRG